MKEGIYWARKLNFSSNYHNIGDVLIVQINEGTFDNTPYVSLLGEEGSYDLEDFDILEPCARYKVQLFKK